MIVFMRRNLKLFFRDRSAVFFSLLSIFIIVGLYAAFLGGVWLPASMAGLPDADFLMNSWLVAGLLAVSSVTTTMGAFGVMIDDKVRKIDRDFFSSPISRGSIAGGYLTSAFLIGCIMSLVTFVVAELYLVLRGGQWLAPVACLKVVGLILFSTMTNTAMVCFLTSFFRSHKAFSSASTILGTLIGFLTGIYLPIGALPASVQTVIKIFPVSHAAVLFRRVLMEVPMETAFTGIPQEYLDEFQTHMGMVYRFGGQEAPLWVSLLVLAAAAAVFFGLCLWSMSRGPQSRRTRNTKPHSSRLHVV